MHAKVGIHSDNGKNIKRFGKAWCVEGAKIFDNFIRLFQASFTEICPAWDNGKYSNHLIWQADLDSLNHPCCGLTTERCCSRGSLKLGLCVLMKFRGSSLLIFYFFLGSSMRKRAFL